jgi:hypothetical protein
MKTIRLGILSILILGAVFAQTPPRPPKFIRRTPAVAGADDIHNLWPESNASTVWDAEVKDELETIFAISSAAATSILRRLSARSRRTGLVYFCRRGSLTPE